MNILRRQLVFFSIGCMLSGTGCANYQGDQGMLGLLSFISVTSGWWNTDWNRRLPISFNNSESTENLTDFPVMIELDSSRIDYTRTQDQGQDLRFIDADNQTELNYEIEIWDESGTSIVWVRVPRIDAGSTSDFIYLYYDNATATSTQSAANNAAVWSNSYLAVWHLNDTSDSTGNFPLTDAGTTAAAGIAGNGRSLAGGTHLEYPALPGAPQEITLSGWGDLPVASVGGSDLISAGDYALIRIDDGGAGALGAYRYTLGFHEMTSGISYAGSGWRNFVFTLSDSANEQFFYVDGARVSAAGFSNAIDWTAGLGTTTRIGTHGDGGTTNNFTGQIDEVRISSAARSLSWNRAQHRSVAGTFQTYGFVETRN